MQPDQVSHPPSQGFGGQAPGWPPRGSFLFLARSTSFLQGGCSGRRFPIRIIFDHEDGVLAVKLESGFFYHEEHEEHEGHEDWVGHWAPSRREPVR